MNMYGQLPAEKVASENTVCRQIAYEISNFGINERQRLMLIYLLAMELENVEHMQSITGLVRELGRGSAFIIAPEDDGELTPPR